MTNALTVRHPTWAIAMAASAGGIPAIQTVLASLPINIPAAVLVVLHLEPSRDSQLSAILEKRTHWPVHAAVDGVTLNAGHAYVGVPDQHLTVSYAKKVKLSIAERVHFVRPAGDVLFSSVANTFGDHAVAVVLSGSGHDGALGAADIRRHGGVVIAQDEATSKYFSMPRTVIELGQADYVLPIERISQQLIELVGV